jgi:hypothetical protein
MLALIAAVCFLLAFFNVTLFDGHSLVALGLVFLALHFVVPVAVPGRRQP